MTKALQNKIDKLSALLISNKASKEQIKKLQQEIALLIARQPDLPHKGDDAWCWSYGYTYYGPWLCRVTVVVVVWRASL